jgi:hypothetical protein
MFSRKGQIKKFLQSLRGILPTLLVIIIIVARGRSIIVIYGYLVKFCRFKFIVCLNESLQFDRTEYLEFFLLRVVTLFLLYHLTCVASNK